MSIHFQYVYAIAVIFPDIPQTQNLCDDKMFFDKLKIPFVFKQHKRLL